jgi:hypothetical protein
MGSGLGLRDGGEEGYCVVLVLHFRGVCWKWW